MPCRQSTAVTPLPSTLKPIPIGVRSDVADFRTWVYPILQIALITWLVVICGMFASKRGAVFLDEYRATARRNADARATYTDCVERSLLTSGSADLVQTCQKARGQLGSPASPFMYGLRAVADVTYMCGDAPCSRVFSFGFVVSMVLAMLAIRILISQVIIRVIPTGQKQKAL